MNLRRVLPFVLVALPLPAFASSARVGARIADLRAEPSADAKSKAKLPSGRDVEVIGKSDDGQWVRVRTECPKANETIKFEGWLAVREVQGANLDGVAVAGSAKKSAPAANDAAWGDSSEKPAAAASSGPAWIDDSGSSRTATASSKDEWGNDASSSNSAPAKPAASSDDAWGSSDSSAPASAPAAAPASSDAGWGSSDSSSSSSSAPAGGDEWSSSGSDSSSSSSSSSGDGW